MHIYKIGYHSCEESHYFEFSHEKLFSNQELKEIVFNCFYDIFPEEKKLCEEANQQSEKFAEDNKLIHNKTFDMKVSLQELIENQNFPKEMKKYGFEVIKYDEEMSFFGWASVEEKDWTNHTDDLTKEVQEFFAKKDNT
jgi:hypothetical protein